MPRELVTKGGRFFCVCLTPDICKTPVGPSTPPIPYMIKGEFSEASGVSKNIRSNGEYVVLHASTVIPTVKGDEPGTAKGIKSGTVGKRVQHDQKSSTVTFNGERAIREGDTVFMNDKNTQGKVLQRGGGSPPASLGDKFDAAMGIAADSISNAEAKVGAHVGRLAQTELGGKVVGALSAVAEMTEVTPLKEAISNRQGMVMDAADTVRNRGLAVASATTVGALSIIPTNLLEMMPGGGKLLAYATKAAKTAAKAAKTAGKVMKAERLGAKVAPAPSSAGAATRSGPASKGGSHPPAKGKDGGTSRGKGKKEKKDKPSNCCPKNGAPGGKRVSSKHPVHFGTGEEVLQQTDFVLGGAIPIAWTRCYRSGSETEDWSMLGARWGSPYTARLSIVHKGIVYHDDTGRALRLPPLDNGQHFDHRGEGFVLVRADDDHFALTWRDGSRDHFARAGTGWLPHGYDGVNAMLPPGQAERCESYALTRSEDPGGRGLDIEWSQASGSPTLLRITTDDGRVIEAMRLPRTAEREVDLVSHVDEVCADGRRICHVSYEYTVAVSDTATPLPRRFDLAAQTDRSGAARHYRYLHHLLTGYTTYGGFEHRLEWISLGTLRERWNGSLVADSILAERHPITTDNSYQARAIATRTSDGRDEATIQYLDEDTTRVTEADGTVFDFTFDENWLAVHVALVPLDGGLPRSLGKRVWDRDGMLIEETDALHRTWRYRYDEAGNLVANTDAEGHTTLLDYDRCNRPIRILDALGNATTYEYDDNGNLLLTTNALGHATRFEYDGRGNVCAQIDARGGRTQYGYDAAGRLTSHTDCSGYRSQYRYDGDDNIVTSVDALEQETEYTYDASGQVTTVTQPDGTQEHYAYDADGNATMHTDALGYKTHFRYDGHGMLTERIDALGHSVKYRYDSALRLIELINGNGESYRFTYTSEGWLACEIGYDGKVTEYRYDDVGQLIAYESCGIAIQLERDRMGRLILKTTPDGLTHYQYDALGRLTAVTAPHAENGFRYDAIGQLLEEHSAYFISEPCPEAYKLRRVPDHYFVMRYAYDELGNRIQTMLPDGHRIDVLRYGSGHWHGVLWDGEPVVDVERDRLHRERRRQIGPQSLNLVATRTYDKLSRVATMVLRRETDESRALPLRDRIFSYDAVGNLLSIRHQWHTASETLGTYTYAYDAIGQLVTAEQQGKKEEFHYDAARNQFSETKQNREVDLTSFRAQGNRVIRYGNLIYKYDERGNTIQKEFTQSHSNVRKIHGYSYDSENRMIAFREIPEQRASVIYVYDAFSRRIAKTIPVANEELSKIATTPIIFLWDLTYQYAEIHESWGTTYTIYEPDSFAPLAMEYSTTAAERPRSHTICDSRGSILDELDGFDSHVCTPNSNPWGRKFEPISQQTHSPHRLAGQYLDSETGLHYNRYRYYDPDSARFLTQDPLGPAFSLNLYAYAPNPFGWSDPLGLTKRKSAQEEIQSLPQFYNKRPCDIRKVLRNRKYTMVGSRFNPTGANSGGQVWTKKLSDGNTAAVRLDPAEPYLAGKPRKADQVPHAHKEIVPTSQVVDGNYPPPGIAGTIMCNDAGLEAEKSDHFGKHIQIQNGKLRKSDD